MRDIIRSGHRVSKDSSFQAWIFGRRMVSHTGFCWFMWAHNGVLCQLYPIYCIRRAASTLGAKTTLKRLNPYPALPSKLLEWLGITTPMIWRHIYSLLTSTAVTAVLLVTRQDFESWYLIPPALVAVSGVTINIRLGRRRRPQSSMLNSVDEEIEAKRRWWEFQKRVENDGSITERQAAYVVLSLIVFAIIIAIVASPETVEVIKRWSYLFGCEC